MKKGFMLDVSRGQIPKFGILKKLIEILSDLNINFISFYIEHTFKYRNHPIIWKNTGAFSQKEIKKTIEYCKKFNIEVIPSIQTMGHFENTLKHKEYAYLAESSLYWSLAPSKKETYFFLEDIIKDIAETFESEYINIGCDEIWDLASEQSKKLAERLGGADKLYLFHILKVKKICEKYNKKIMMWGDMLLKYPSILKNIPKDVVVLNWNYDELDVKDFKKRLSKIGKNNIFQIICPGVSAWSALFPNVKKAETNITNFIKAGFEYKKRIEGFMLTSWGDDGNFNFLSEALPGIFIFGYVLANNGKKIDSKNFDNFFQKLFEFKNYNFSIYKIFLFFGNLFKNLNFEKYYELFYTFWDIYAFEDFVKTLSYEKIKNLYKIAFDYFKIFSSFKPKKNIFLFKELLYKLSFEIFVLKRILYSLEIKSLYEQAYKKLCDEKTVNFNLTQIINMAKEIYKEILKLKKKYKKLWKRNYRGEGLECNLKRFTLLVRYYKKIYKIFFRIKQNYVQEGGVLLNPNEIFSQKFYKNLL